MTLRFLFFLLVLGYVPQVKGQQIISSMGGLFENERISCQVTMGEVETGNRNGPVSSSIQFIPGTFSPSDGIISTTGNEQLSTKKPVVACSLKGTVLHLSQPDETPTDCTVYSVRGQLLYHSEFRTTRHEISLQPLSPGIYFIRIMQGKHCYTYKMNLP